VPVEPQAQGPHLLPLRRLQKLLQFEEGRLDAGDRRRDLLCQFPLEGALLRRAYQVSKGTVPGGGHVGCSGVKFDHFLRFAADCPCHGQVLPDAAQEVKCLGLDEL
jgi:hypothetical protein